MISTNSLNDYLYLLEKFVPQELIAVEEWAKINRIGKILPSGLTTFFGFESRLGIAEARGDFLICADAVEAGRRVLAANSYDIDLPDELLNNPVWMNIRKLSTNRESEDSPHYEKVSNVWPLHLQNYFAGPVHLSFFLRKTLIERKIGSDKIYFQVFIHF